MASFLSLPLGVQTKFHFTLQSRSYPLSSKLFSLQPPFKNLPPQFLTTKKKKKKKMFLKTGKRT